MIKTINIIGAGNVATHLVKQLTKNKEIQIKTLYSRNIVNAITLTKGTKIKSIDLIKQIDCLADLTIIAIKDDAIIDVIEQLPKSISIVHTSGSIALNVLSAFKNSGILYPLQTFSKSRSIDVTSIPFLIESHQKEFESKLVEFCSTNLSTYTQITNSELRSEIHLAAVISNNFMTALLNESSKILNNSNLKLNLLEPLIQETIAKAFILGPKKAQTGPAKRKDINVINSQKQKIKNPLLKSIYELITQLIQNQ